MDGPYVFIEDVPDAKGNPRHLQTTKLRFYDASGRLCVLGMCVDVTEMARLTTQETEGRVRAQEAQKHQVLREQLEEQEKEAAQQLKMITALAADYRSVYYIELDRDAAVCYQAHTGLENSYQVGDQFPYLSAFTSYAESYVPDPFREEFIRFIQPDAIRERLKNERVISYRYIVKHGAQEAYEMIRFAGVRHPEDRDDHLVHNVSACFSDVDSETRHTLAQSQALSDALRAAEDASKAKTVFLSNMSHEIRTPMNAIIGLNNIALNDPATPAHTREYLLKMNTSAHHLLNIINDILDMSRIESGRMTIRSEEFSFAGMLEQVNTIINGQCRDKGLNYECRLVGDIHDYYIGDDMKLRQVLINILGNSVKFTPEGGSVTFLVEETAHYDGKTTLRFVMRDTGIGMSPEFLPRIFDTFSQEETRVANRYGSTGLGMPITKSIVELMNGTIGVESEKGKGTTFTVTLTFKDAHHAGLADQEGDLKPNEMSVLVIDDDVVAREHAKIVLGQVGIGCELAASGEEGLEMVRMRHARRDPYHLILIDWKMPEMDGVETTRHIRAVVGDGTPIIILTSYNWEDIAEEARKAGVDTFVPKPLFAASVMDEFRTAFRRKNIATTRRQVDLAGKRILLAEDVPVNAEIMMMVLSMRQMEVDLAENGRIAIELFASHPEHTYAAILMDMRMPEMDGLEATTAIRAMDRADAQTIPIIALTANAFDEDVQRSMQAGLNAHLSKPVEPKTLYATLEGLIEEDK
ncbi:MAG: response regulator, partial [Clostridia bacterium]|nr:response regulator [Clostridia bacterium]